MFQFETQIFPNPCGPADIDLGSNIWTGNRWLVPKLVDWSPQRGIFQLEGKRSPLPSV